MSVMTEMFLVAETSLYNLSMIVAHQTGGSDHYVIYIKIRDDVWAQVDDCNSEQPLVDTKTLLKRVSGTKASKKCPKNQELATLCVYERV